MTENNITLRPVQDCDQEFLVRVYGSSREQELAQVPWAPEQKDAFVRMQWQAQTRHYALEHPRAEHLLICMNATPAGRLYIDRSGHELHILDVTVLTQYRRQGVGGFLLRQILEEARAAARPVTIYLESFNPSLAWFERLGFVPVEQKGFHILMKWQAAQHS